MITPNKLSLTAMALLGCCPNEKEPFDRPVLRETEGLRANGIALTRLIFPFMLSLSKHKNLWATARL